MNKFSTNIILVFTTCKSAANVESKSFDIKGVKTEPWHGRFSNSAFANKQNGLNQFDFNFSQIPLQPKLKINAPNDRYEQEADKIANKVVNMNDTIAVNETGKTSINRKTLADEISNISTNTTQRKCTKCEEEEENMVQRKNISSNSVAVPHFFTNQLSATKGGGSEMDSATNQFMSSRFGVDFDNVRIHNGSRANAMSQSINARAFTLGNDIYFGKSGYRPNTIEGKQLLAHELTHVVQQASNKHKVQRKPNPKASQAQVSNVKKAIAAQKLMWEDLKTHLPKDVRKLSGSSYDESIGYLKADFTEGTVGGVSTSAPIMKIGKSYVDEQDGTVRKAKLEAEILKIDRFRVKKGMIDDQDIGDATVFALIDRLNVKQKTQLVGKMKAQKHINNSNILEKIKKKMPSTPVSSGATVRSDGGFEFKFENVKIKVLPDVFNSSAVSSGGVTKIDQTSGGSVNFPAVKWNGSGIITSIGTMPTKPQIVFQIQTHYASGVDPSGASGYGVGTELTAKGEEKHLRTHEGAHGNTFINHIKNNINTHKYPNGTVVVGDHRDKYNDHRTEATAFFDMLKEASEKAVVDVDCAGTVTIEEHHHKHGTTTSVHCSTP